MIGRAFERFIEHLGTSRATVTANAVAAGFDGAAGIANELDFCHATRSQFVSFFCCTGIQLACVT